MIRLSAGIEIIPRQNSRRQVKQHKEATFTRTGERDKPLEMHVKE